jgi:putative transcriptional regulator
MTRKGYHYTESGLDFVYLVKGVDYADAPHGKTVTIHNIDGLHKAIGRFLIEERKSLSGQEIRFLRHELLLSQGALAKIMGVEEQTVRRWEQDKVAIPRTADVSLRVLYSEHIGGNDKLSEMLHRLADFDDAIDRLTLTLFGSPEGWVVKDCKAA